MFSEKRNSLRFTRSKTVYIKTSFLLTQKLNIFINVLVYCFRTFRLTQEVTLYSRFWRDQNNLWNLFKPSAHLFFKSTTKIPKQRTKLFKVNKKDTRTMSMTSFWYFYVNFEQNSTIVLVFLLLALNKLILARKRTVQTLEQSRLTLL